MSSVLLLIIINIYYTKKCLALFIVHTVTVFVPLLPAVFNSNLPQL